MNSIKWNKNACLGGILAFNARASQQRRPYLIRRSLKGKSNDVGRPAFWSGHHLSIVSCAHKRKTNKHFLSSFLHCPMHLPCEKKNKDSPVLIATNKNKERHKMVQSPPVNNKMMIFKQFWFGLIFILSISPVVIHLSLDSLKSLFNDPLMTVRS